MKKKTNTIDEAMKYIDYIEGERWAVIPNHSQYLISNYGRIFGFAHKAIKDIKVYKGQKYLVTRLYDDNGVLSNSKLVHRLVAEVFCDNPEPELKTVVHHINCNSLDNRAENLIWLTPQEHTEIHNQIRAERKRRELMNNEA